MIDENKEGGTVVQITKKYEKFLQNKKLNKTEFFSFCDPWVSTGFVNNI